MEKNFLDQLWVCRRYKPVYGKIYEKKIWAVAIGLSFLKLYKFKLWYGEQKFTQCRCN